MDRIKMVEKDYLKKEVVPFKVGDTVRVLVKIPEQDKVRVHPFEGIVIAKKGSGTRASFTVRKISYGEGIERVFSLRSPSIDKIELVRCATRQKRAKLYYIRKKVGKEATEVD
jgi:large subunit ribosomal protein L19